jgi:hypothetical protein
MTLGDFWAFEPLSGGDSGRWEDLTDSEGQQPGPRSAVGLAGGPAGVYLYGGMDEAGGNVTIKL